MNMKTTEITKTTKLFIPLCIFILFMINPDSSAAASLQEQIDEADAGDTVTVEEGTYEEVLHIDKPIHLKGLGDQQSRLLNKEAGTIVFIDSDDVVIEGIAFEHTEEDTEEEVGYRQVTDPFDPEPVISADAPSDLRIIDNTFDAIGSGVYVTNGTDIEVARNSLIGVEAVYFMEGNAVELYDTVDVELRDNRIRYMMDGFYLDTLSRADITGNDVSESRYATHLMFSDQVTGDNNTYTDNVNGMMIMDSTNSSFSDNVFEEHFDVRGFGAMIFRSENIELLNNRISQNSTGVQLQETRGTTIRGNAITGNHVGLSWNMRNPDFVFTNNDMISNIIQTQALSDELPLDAEGEGNYWDDYFMEDLTGDGVGELTYESGTVYDLILEEQPEWQLFFESPAVSLWSQTEEWLPAIGRETAVDNYPKVEEQWAEEPEQQTTWVYVTIGIVFLASAAAIIYYYRRNEYA